MQLSKRLQAVVEMVSKGSRVADIGCDHAYVSIYMIEHNIADTVIALDVNKGPLERAKDNILKNNMQERIETRLSDGMKELKTQEVDTILLAGMGGGLMQRILSGNKEVLAEVEELVLQPQSDIRQVRVFLEQIGFQIIKENMILEDGKYYVMMKAQRKERVEFLGQEVFYRYGKNLLENKNMCLLQFLRKEENKMQMIQKCLQENPSELNRQRLKKLQEDVTYCKEGLAYYDM